MMTEKKKKKDDLLQWKKERKIISKIPLSKVKSFHEYWNMYKSKLFWKIKNKQNPKHRVQKRVTVYKETMTWWKIARFVKNMYGLSTGV